MLVLTIRIAHLPGSPTTPDAHSQTEQHGPGSLAESDEAMALVHSGDWVCHALD
jgi:hypothetical protein